MSMVKTDNQEVARCIGAMKELVLARGGLVHPAAQIEERDGALKVTCRGPRGDGHLLFNLPNALFVPTSDLCWSPRADVMELAKPPIGLSTDQREMLDLFVAIYNATGKMRWVKDHAAVVISRDTDLASQLNLIMTLNEIEHVSLQIAFLQNRHFEKDEIQDGKPCIAPLADFLNHNAAGDEPEVHSGCLAIRTTRPTGSDECFLNYGRMRDPLGLALNYNCLDAHSPFAGSVPADIHLTEFGRLVITSRFVTSNNRFKPPKIDFTEDGLCISHLVGDARAPHRVLNMLRLAMMASGKRRAINSAAVERAINEARSAILEANRARLADFIAYLATRQDLPLALLLSQASLLQLANLEKILAQ